MPAITPAQIAALNSATFTTAADVESWSQARLNNHFLPWFNQKLANKGFWTDVTLVDNPANRVGFHAFWNNIDILIGGAATPFQFVALMGIFANECRANFKPVAEKMGLPGFPGLTYLFDAIPRIKKRSYNTIARNKNAQQCFGNAAFNTAHGAKPLAARLRNTTDARWAGPAYPRDVPFDNDANLTGYVMEADFMKFRGRGFIQTTGRANYAKIIEYIQNYTGANNVIDFYQAKWIGMSIDDIAFSTSNEDWDRLFQETDLIIAAQAIHLHNTEGRNYLALTGDPDKAILNMGLKISGGNDYAVKYRNRMEALIVQVSP